MSPPGPPSGGAPPSLTLPKKPVSNSASTGEEPQPNPSFVVPGTAEGINHPVEGDADISSSIQKQLTEESREEKSGTPAAGKTPHGKARGKTVGKAPPTKELGVTERGTAGQVEGSVQSDRATNPTTDEELAPPTIADRRKTKTPTPIKKTLTHSSPRPSPTVPGTVKGSSSRRPSTSVSLSRASTPAPSMAIVRKEKPGPLSSSSGLENAVAMVVGGNLITGLSNCLTAIDEAPKDEQVDLTMGLATSVSNSLGMMGSVAEKVDDFVEARGFRSEEYLENNAALVNLAATIRADRDKVGTRNRKIKANWSKHKRGQEFIDQYLGPDTKLGGVTCIGYLATLTENYQPIPLIQMFNLAIGQRLTDLVELKAAGKSLTGKNAIKGLTSGDVTTVFKSHQEAKVVDVSNIGLPSSEGLRSLGLELDEIGLTVGAGMGRPPLRFDDEVEEPVFVWLGAIEPVPGPKSLPGPAQEEESEGNGGEAAGGVEKVIDKVIDEAKTDDKDREAPEDVDLDNPFNGEDPFGQEDKEHALELQKARAGKKPMDAAGTKDRPVEIDTFLEMVQETSKEAITKRVGALDMKLDPMTIIDGLAARELVQQTLAELEQDGQDVSVIVRNTSKALAVPGMVRDFKIPKEKDLQLSEDCKCQISNSIKKRLEYGDQVNLVVNSEEKWKLYPKLNKLPSVGGACEFHLRRFADYMGLRSKGLTFEKLQNRLSSIDKNKRSLNAYLSTNEVSTWLKHDKNIEYIRRHANLGASKYLPQPLTPEGRFDLSGFGTICRGAFKEEIRDFMKVGAGVIKYANLKWLMCVARGRDGNSKSPLFSKIAHEFNQFNYHCRFETKALQGYALLNTLYSVIQQVARMDHGLYLGAVVSRRDGATKLVCYPEHARFLSSERDDTDSFSIVEIDMPEKEKGKRVSDRVVDYIIVSRVEAEVANAVVRFIEGSHKHADILMKQKGTKQRLYLYRGPGTAKKSVPTVEKRLIATCGDWKPITVDTGDAVYAKQGTYIGFNPDIGESFRVISNNYTAVDEEGKLENGVLWSDLHRAVLDQAAPPVPRWASPKDVPPSAVPFQAYRSVTGAGALSEALLGRMKFTDRAVVAEMDALFAKDESELETHLTAHRKILRKIVETEIQASFEDEYRLYSTRSFEEVCRQLRDNKRPTIPEGAPEIPPSYLQALFEDGALISSKSFTVPGPEIEESDNEPEMEGWEEGFVEVNEGPSEAVRRARKQILSEAFAYDDDAELGIDDLDPEKVLGVPSRAEDSIPEGSVVSGPSAAEEGVRWRTDSLAPLPKTTAKRRRLVASSESDVASKPSPPKKTKVQKPPAQPVRHSSRLSNGSSKTVTTPTKATGEEAASET
jgi:hypothetical protein